MIKDPLDIEETPYDLLEIEPIASHDEVHKALPKFVRKKENLPKLGKANEAVRRLRNPKERLEIDFFYYSLQSVSLPDDIEVKEFDPKFFDSVTVPIFNVGEFYTDLEKEDYSENYSDIEIKDLTPMKIEKYKGLDSFKLETSFDL